MESLSRPPHRRKHSTTTANVFSSSLSFKNPYAGVLLSRVGERKSLEAHEYSEIFSGSSSIPVLDFSGLDERVESGDSRSSKLDFSSILGGFGNDDVFVSYEELLSDSAKKTKPRIPTEQRHYLQESGSQCSSRKMKKPSGEASNKSTNGVQQQINMSFNRSHQRDGDALVGKTHIAELHAVPGFTHFTGGMPQLEKLKDDKLLSLKREVSRTWSFSAEVGPVKDEGAPNCETSQVHGKSQNVKEVNLKPQFLNVSPPSSRPSNLSGNKDRGKSRASLAVKQDATQKIAGECSPHFFGEEFDENSVDAVSAAALKKAVEQAQESIRIAKMIMERKKEVYQDGSKTRSNGSLKVSDREAKIHCKIYVSRDTNANEKHEELDHIFTDLSGIDGKFTPLLSQNDAITYASNSEVERIHENVVADKENGEAFAGKTEFASNFCHSERLNIDKNTQLEMVERNVEAAKTQREANDFPGLVSSPVSGTVDLEPEKVGNVDSSVPSICELNLGEMEMCKENLEQRKVISYHKEASEVSGPLGTAPRKSRRAQWMKKNVEEGELHQAALNHAKEPEKMVERALDTSQNAQVTKKSVEEDGLRQVKFGHAEGPENMVEMVPSACQRTPEHYKVVDEAGGNLNIGQEGEVSKQRDNETNDKEKHGKKLQLHEEMLNVEHLVLGPEINNVLNETCDMGGTENPDQEEMNKKSVEEDGLSQAKFGHAEGPENMVEMVPSACQRTPEYYKVVDEAGENLNISREGELSKQRENGTNDKEKPGKKLQLHEEMLNVEHLVLGSEINNVLNETCDMVGTENPDLEEMHKRSESVSEWKRNGQHGKTCDEEISMFRQKEADRWFESKEQLSEDLLEDITQRELNVPPEVGEVEKKVEDAHGPEIDDQKRDCIDDVDEPKLAEELMQNKVGEEHVNTYEYEAAGTIMMEPNHHAGVQKRGAYLDDEESDNTLGGAGRSEGDHTKCEFEEAAYEEDINKAVELDTSKASTIFDEAHTIDCCNTINSETQEACNTDSNNKAEKHRETAHNYQENDTMPLINETVSAVGKEKPLSHLQDNEILGTYSLHRSAIEENFVESKMGDKFECLSSNGKMESGFMDAESVENPSEDNDVTNTTSDIQDDVKVYGQFLFEDLASGIRTPEFDFTDLRQVLEQTSESDEGSVSHSSTEKMDGLDAHESEHHAENAEDMTSENEEVKDELETSYDERKFAEELSEGLHSELQSKPKEIDKPEETERSLEGSPNMQNNEENLPGTSFTEERDAKESVQNFESDDQLQRIEAIKRGRERAKDRIAVERAIREVRGRAFAEARERAAVEKAAAEARQRVMAEAREKIEKATTEAKLKAERAAVERVTAEARERALEKAVSQKFSTEARTPTDRHNGLKHSFSSSDLESGSNTESAQRRKARLERHQRIMERAAKALAEKNMRDLLVQKEQAERNRLAESLDADIKRWATGKEGNLRALLSTLQYILGPDSGWQPISLTEIITTAAVKKAYRKATLYVHPDKLQQRGASVQQKYMCEKVFDLLKAAWNRFNSDER